MGFGTLRPHFGCTWDVEGSTHCRKNCYLLPKVPRTVWFLPRAPAGPCFSLQQSAVGGSDHESYTRGSMQLYGMYIDPKVMLWYLLHSYMEPLGTLARWAHTPVDDFPRL